MGEGDEVAQRPITCIELRVVASVYNETVIKSRRVGTQCECGAGRWCGRVRGYFTCGDRGGVEFKVLVGAQSNRRDLDGGRGWNIVEKTRINVRSVQASYIMWRGLGLLARGKEIDDHGRAVRKLES